MFIRAMLVLFTLTAVACGKAPQISEENASVSDVAAKVREASATGRFVRPGQWQSKMTIEEITVPGMPKDQVERMRAMVERNQQEFSTCLKPEDVEQPGGTFFTGNEECRYDHFEMAKGKIDAALRCPAGQGMTQLFEMNGTYAPEHYEMHMTMTGKKANGPTAGMTMKMKVVSDRTGECAG